MGPMMGLLSSLTRSLLEDLDRIRAATRKKGRAGIPGRMNPSTPRTKNTPTTA